MNKKSKIYMAISKDKKIEIVKNLTQKIHDARSIIFVGFNGLTVDESTQLRGNLRKDDSLLYVSKKTLLAKVLNDEHIEGEQPALIGEVAIAYSDDHVAPARNIHAFAKETDGKVEILGGVMEGRYLSKEDANALALIPGKDVLLGMFVNVINSPVSGFVRTLGAVPQKFVRTLSGIQKTK